MRTIPGGLWWTILQWCFIRVAEQTRHPICTCCDSILSHSRSTPMMNSVTKQTARAPAKPARVCIPLVLESRLVLPQSFAPASEHCIEETKRNENHHVDCCYWIVRFRYAMIRDDDEFVPVRCLVEIPFTFTIHRSSHSCFIR